MGRIAEALKKAQQERQKTLRTPSTDSSVVVAEPAAPHDGSPVSAIEEDFQEGVLADESFEAQVSTFAMAGAISQPPSPMASAPADSQIDPAVIAYHDRASVISEQYRSVRTRLLSQNPTNQHRTIAITSAVPAEGKSVTSLNLAFVMAELRHLNILVVDGDFRRHCLASMLGTSEDPGLAELIMGQASQPEVTRATAVPNLHFIQIGRASCRERV